jgi:hypothetical protein
VWSVVTEWEELLRAPSVEGLVVVEWVDGPVLSVLLVSPSAAIVVVLMAAPSDAGMASEKLEEEALERPVARWLRREVGGSPMAMVLVWA